VKKKRCFIAVFIVLAVCLVSTGAMAYQVETEKPSRFAISKLEVESAKIAAEDSTVGVLQAVGDAITDWADWLAVGTKPSMTYDMQTDRADLGVQLTFWPGEQVDGVIGHIPATNRYYIGIERTFEDLPMPLLGKIDNVSLGFGGSANPDLSKVEGIFWMSWNLRA